MAADNPSNQNQDTKIPFDARGEITIGGRTFAIEAGPGKRPGSIRVQIEAPLGDMRGILDLLLAGFRAIPK